MSSSFLTNHLSLPAATLAELYRQRWQSRAVLSTTQAKPASQDFRGHLGQRPQDPNLDRADSAVLVKFLQLRSKFSWHLSP